MVGRGSSQIDALANHVAKLLGLTGILYGLAALNTAIVFVNEGYAYRQLSGPLLLIGLLASILALLGIYARAGDGAGTIGQATGAAAALALVVVVILLLIGIAGRLGVGPGTPGPLAIVGVLLFIASFAFAGWTVLRTATYPPRVGYLLLAEALALVLVVVVPTVVYQGSPPDAYTLAIELAQAIILLLAAAGIRETSAGTGQAVAAGGGKL